jgi:esterase/lipase superfamily enzyme
MDHRPLDCPGVDGRLIEIPCENVRWNRGSTRRDFHEFIGSFIISACNVVELEAVEFVLKAPHLFAVGFHLGITAA